MLSSTSSSLACNSLRPTSSARTSWASAHLALHRTVPAHAQQLRDPAGVFAIRLHRHRRQCRLHMPCLQQHHLKAGVDQTLAQPLRQRACLKADADDRRSQIGNVSRARTASITLEDPSRENASCGDQVSTAQTTMLPANVNQRRNTKQRFALHILLLNASPGLTRLAVDRIMSKRP